MNKYMVSIIALAPGLLLASGIAIFSIIATCQWPWLQAHGISALTLAMILGMGLIHGIHPLQKKNVASGIGFAKQHLLRIGIVLYGFRLTMQDLIQLGGTGLVIDILIVTSTFFFAYILGTRLLGLDRRLSIVIGAGSAVCGAAAVMATAPIIKASEEQSVVAVTTVVIFGTLMMFLYPLLYQWNTHNGGVYLDAHGFGLWMGSTIHEVAQVVAAGQSINPKIADTAVITKMVRVILLAPLLFGLSIWQRRKLITSTSSNDSALLTFPWFALGFIAMIGFNSLNRLPASGVNLLIIIDHFLLTVAMAALGLSIYIKALHQAGWQPLLLAFLLFIWLIAGGWLINFSIRTLF